MTMKESRNCLLQMVEYSGRQYEMRELILWFDKLENTYRYSALLVDRECNSSLRVPLEDVHRLEGDENES